MPLHTPSARRLRVLLAMGVCSAALCQQGAWAQTSAPAAGAEPVAAAASAPPAPRTGATTQLDPVEVRGSSVNDTQLRRQSTAATITIGRDEIERFGDSTVGDLLKRLPGVTMQGRPGRGGNIRMRGLGSGYTQILLDGERVPAGFSIDSLNPEQIERIEIQRAPTAETGARAIAGTINIITREGFSKKLNDVRVAVALENDALQPGLTWTRNDALAGLDYNYSLTLFRNDKRNDSVTTLEQSALDTGLPLLTQTENNQEREKRHGIHATGRLQWRGDAGQSATLMPLIIDSRGNTQRDAQLVRTPATPLPAFDSAHSDATSHFSLLRLNGQWMQRLAEGSRIEVRGGAGRTSFKNHSVRIESGGLAPNRFDDDADNTERTLNLSGKFTALLGDGEHSLVSGVELESNRRVEARTLLEDGAPSQTEFPEELEARVRRLALYAQDEWSVSPNWSAQGGLRWEGITTRGNAKLGDPDVENRSSVWSPLLHLLWKPDPAGRDQLRMSLTRSYRSPSLSNLIARPRLSTANSPTKPDRAGNPALRPELATGVDIAVEHYLPGSGLLSANLFQRRISDYMRSVPDLEIASGRYVARTQNVGSALTRGLELEAKFRLSAVIPDAPNVDLRANASVFRSRVDNVPGPNNRIDQQPDWTANFGADYRIPNTPLLLGASVNLTPGYTTRVSVEQTSSVNGKIVGDAFALWTFSPTLQARLTASNFAPRDYVTGSSFDDASPANLRESSQTVAPTYLNVQLRLEFKL
jgi:outer membrane receptor for ferrienterochelin and colicins